MEGETGDLLSNNTSWEPNITLTWNPTDNTILKTELPGNTTIPDAEGQLISKCLFRYCQFSQKMNEKIQLYYYGSSSRIAFIRLSRELKTPKRHSEIN